MGVCDNEYTAARRIAGDHAFYIPPEIKLVAEIQVIVSAGGKIDAAYREGMLIKFSNVSCRNINLLEDYVEGKKHLIDGQV